MELSEKGPITQVRLLFDGKHGTETVRINDEVAQIEADNERLKEQLDVCLKFEPFKTWTEENLLTAEPK